MINYKSIKQSNQNYLPIGDVTTSFKVFTQNIQLNQQQPILTTSVYKSKVSQSSNKSHISQKSNNNSHTSQRLLIFQRAQSIKAQSRLCQNIRSLSNKKKQKKFKDGILNSIRSSTTSHANYKYRSKSSNFKQEENDQKMKILNQIVQKLKGRQYQKQKQTQIISHNKLHSSGPENGKNQILKNKSNKLEGLLKDIKQSNKQNYKAIYTIKKTTVKNQPTKQVLRANRFFQNKSEVGKTVNQSLQKKKSITNIRILQVSNHKIKQETKPCITCGCLCKAKNRAQGKYLSPRQQI